MGIFDGVLLCSDFDNTLVDTDTARATGTTPVLSEKNREALEYFISEGGYFSVATGRALPGFRKFHALVPKNVPCVICNGAALYDFSKEEYMENIVLKEPALEHAQQLMDRYPTLGLEAYHIDNCIYAVRENEFVTTHKHITSVELLTADSLANVPVPLGKIIFEDERDVLEEALAWAKQQPWSGLYEIGCSSKNILEMTSKGATKGDMVLRLAKLLNVAEDHVYCAGDETNDLSMLRVAAEGFCPANAAEAVLNCGATVVRACKDDAMAEIIDRLKENYSR